MFEGIECLRIIDSVLKSRCLSRVKVFTEELFKLHAFNALNQVLIHYVFSVFTMKKE